MDDIVRDIKYEISNEENINLEKVIDKYCKQLKKCLKEYYNTYGLEDYKMNNIDIQNDIYDYMVFLLYLLYSK